MINNKDINRIGHQDILPGYYDTYHKSKTHIGAKQLKYPLLVDAHELKERLAGGPRARAVGVDKEKQKIINNNRDVLNKYTKEIQEKLNQGDLDQHEVVKNISKNLKSAEPNAAPSQKDIEKFVELVMSLAKHATTSNTKTNWIFVTNTTKHIELLLNHKDYIKYKTKHAAEFSLQNKVVPLFPEPNEPQPSLPPSQPEHHSSDSASTNRSKTSRNHSEINSVNATSNRSSVSPAEFSSDDEKTTRSEIQQQKKEKNKEYNNSAISGYSIHQSGISSENRMSHCQHNIEEEISNRAQSTNMLSRSTISDKVNPQINPPQKSAIKLPAEEIHNEQKELEEESALSFSDLNNSVIAASSIPPSGVKSGGEVNNKVEQELCRQQSAKETIPEENLTNIQKSELKSLNLNRLHSNDSDIFEDIQFTASMIKAQASNEKYQQLMENISSVMQIKSSDNSGIWPLPMFKAVINYLHLNGVLTGDNIEIFGSDFYDSAQACVISYNGRQVIFGCAANRESNLNLINFVEEYKTAYPNSKPLVVTLAGAQVREQEHMFTIEKAMRVNHLMLVMQIPGEDTYYQIDPKGPLGGLHGPHVLPSAESDRSFGLHDKIHQDIIYLDQQGFATTNCVRFGGSNALLLILHHLFKDPEPNIHDLIAHALTDVYKRNQQTYTEKIVNVFLESKQAQNLGNHLLQVNETSNHNYKIQWVNNNTLNGATSSILEPIQNATYNFEIEEI